MDLGSTRFQWSGASIPLTHQSVFLTHIGSPSFPTYVAAERPCRPQLGSTGLGSRFLSGQIPQKPSPEPCRNLLSSSQHCQRHVPNPIEKDPDQLFFTTASECAKRNGVLILIIQSKGTPNGAVAEPSAFLFSSRSRPKQHKRGCKQQSLAPPCLRLEDPQVRRLEI